MNKANLLLAAVLMFSAPAGAQNETDVIGKQNIKLASKTMTPEALWAMGRISSYEASPDGKRIVYQVGYYSVKQNKSHHVLYVMNADAPTASCLPIAPRTRLMPPGSIQRPSLFSPVAKYGR